MASKLAEIRKHLKKHGWKLVKNGSKHFLYGKEDKVLLIPKGARIYTRTYNQILWKIEGKTDVSKDVQISLDI